MQTTLAATALLMGLAGGPHCLAMCAAPCMALQLRNSASPWRATWLFQGGRMAGYAVAGATAAFASQTLAWASSSATALRPAWTLFHLAVLAWALLMLARARQPDWVHAMGNAVWKRLQPVGAARAGLFGVGMLWAFMPCGLLYSALLVAALSGGAAAGALSMVLFALGSGAWLVLAPWVLARMSTTGTFLRDGWGTRAAGALLSIAAGWALWADVSIRVREWCA